MTKEGRIRENLLIKDGWRDSLLYSVLDYERKRKLVSMFLCRTESDMTRNKLFQHVHIFLRGEKKKIMSIFKN